jgi:hypothetical protein
VPTPVDFVNVSVSGLESSPHVETLAGLRANEARYFKNKYEIVYETSPDRPELVEYVSRVLTEKNIVISSPPLEVAEVFVDDIRWTFVFYQSGLAINVMYSQSDPKKRAVGFKLSDGMDVPAELVDKFKFARMKSKLAGTIRGSYFVVKGEY